MPSDSRENQWENGSTVHPSHEFLQEIAGKTLSPEEVRNGFPALWAHLEECEECSAAFAELLRLAHEKGHQEGHAEEAKSRRAVVLTAMVGIVAVVIVAGGFAFWQLRTGENAVERAYNKVSPAVADIQVQSASVTGSGVVFDKAGHILTNYHVIKDAQSAQDIVVKLPNLGQVPSTLVGYDIATDLAVLKVDPPPIRLTVAKFGNSSKVEVGDVAIAIGNPFGLSDSLTAGHISAVGRQFMSNDPYAPDVPGILQTDAAINPGNSGGPLLNAGGQVIGINSRIQSPSGGSAGIGFAIPSNLTLQVARDIISQGYVLRPFLGAGGRASDATLAKDLGLPVDHGLLVQEVYPNSPAAQIGLNAGSGTVKTSEGEVKKGADVILSLDGQSVNSQGDLNRLVAQHAVGDTVKLGILRNGQPLTLEATLARRAQTPIDGQPANPEPTAAK